MLISSGRCHSQSVLLKHSFCRRTNADRWLCNERASSACPKLVPNMIIQWRTMERTSLSITHLRPLTEGIQPSLTAGRSAPLWKMGPPARTTAAPSGCQHAKQREMSAPTSLDHLPNPGDPSLAKATLWRTRWELGGWGTARRAWATRPRLDPRQTRSEMTRRLPLQAVPAPQGVQALGTSRSPTADPSLLSRQDPVCSGTGAAVCPSMRGDHAASRATAPSTVSDPPRYVCLRWGTWEPCPHWRWTLRRPAWGQLIGLTRIVWIMLRWPERGRNSTGTWVTVGSWRAWVLIVPRWAPWDPPTVFLAPSDPRMWGTGTVHTDNAAIAIVWSHISFQIDLFFLTRLPCKCFLTNTICVFPGASSKVVCWEVVPCWAPRSWTATSPTGKWVSTSPLGTCRERR